MEMFKNYDIITKYYGISDPKNIQQKMPFSIKANVTDIKDDNKVLMNTEVSWGTLYSDLIKS